MIDWEKLSVWYEIGMDVLERPYFKPPIVDPTGEIRKTFEAEVTTTLLRQMKGVDLEVKISKEMRSRLQIGYPGYVSLEKEKGIEGIVRQVIHNVWLEGEWKTLDRG